MKQDIVHQSLKQKYQYSKSSPEFTSVDGKYKTFKATQKQISLNVTIKILVSSIDPALSSYINKLKSIKSQQVIKIYEVIVQNDFIAVVTQQVSYGTLGTALASCKKLDDNDSLFLCKYLLTGYMQVARAGINWQGMMNDIEITQSGIKLSWNNSILINPQSANTFPSILESLSIDKIPENQQRLLPFPQSKQLKELFRLAQSSASQISLSPVMKKKEKYIKKKFKQYLLIRESKYPGEYFEQTIYLGVSKDNGIVRIKCYKKGVIKPAILQLNKTKNTFTKVLQTIQENNLLYIVSAYSNDGTLQSYVQKLKTAGIQLKQDQIQFFFYSLFQPIKAIQESSIRSLNMSLHIRNIYIESGIPKIGEPIPMGEQVKEKLRDRADVPDFYHKRFKQKPQNSDSSYDTYSLGVLLYKLMFTEYPIFPNGLVHIPTAPSFSSRLKKTLQLFLDQGGKLSQIQKKIQVSENVLKQVKKNKQALLMAKNQQQKKISKQKRRYDKILAEQDEDISQRKNSYDSFNQPITHQQDQDQQQIQDDCFDCFVNLEIADSSIDPAVQSLQESPYKTYRLCTKLFCFLLLYVLLMYMFYLRDVTSMLSKQSSLVRLNVTISTIKYEIITEDSAQFYLKFNQTSKLVTDLYTMGCLVNSISSNDYSEVVSSNSIKWLSYLIVGLLTLVLILVMKSVLIFHFDYIKAKYNYQHSITNFNYSNYLIINLLIASLINQHFQLFNLIFYTSLPACLGNIGSKMYSTIQYLLSQNPKFLYIHLPVFLGLVIITLIHFIIVSRTDKVKYSKIFNPILLFTPFLLAYWSIVRIGALKYFFYPSAINDSQNIIKNYFLTGDYIGILGTVPQILFILEIIINKLIDLFYWMLIDKKRRVMIQQTSTQTIQLYH